MKLKASQDIDAPIEAVFKAAMDVRTIEQRATQRGIALRRSGAGVHFQEGETWDAEFTYRAKKRSMHSTINKISPPDQIMADALVGGILADCVLDFVPLTPTKTRLSLQMTLKGKSMTAWIFLKSLLLGRARIERKLQTQFSQAAQALARRAQH